MSLLLFAAAALQVSTPAPPVEHPPHVIARGGAQAGGPMQQLMAGYRTCIEARVAATPATVTPETGASAAMAACKSEHDALIANVTTMVSAMPADRQEMIKARIAEREAAMPAQIAERIRASRAGTPAPAR